MTLNEIMTQLKILFDFDLSFNQQIIPFPARFSKENCQKIFDDISFGLLGEEPTCGLSADDDKSFIINLGFRYELTLFD